MRLIDADEMIKNLKAMKTMYDAIEIDGMIKGLEESKTVDAEPVQFGHWEWCETWLDECPEYPCELLKEGWACSACGVYLMEYLKSHFHDIESYAECISGEMPTVERCPHCGAKMMEKQND